MRTDVAAWTLLAITAASLEPVLVKLGYRAAATPVQLLAVKALVGSVLILPLTRRAPVVPVADLPRVIAVSVLLLATSALTLLALTFTTATAVITAVTTTPALVALVNQGRGREVLGGRFWLGFWMCFAGVVLTVSPTEADVLATGAPALLCLAGAVVTSTTYRLLVEDLTSRNDPLVISTCIFLIGGALASGMLLPLSLPIPAAGWSIGLWTGAAAALANVAFVAAIAALGATRMSIFNLLQRPLVIAAAALILAEPLTLTQLLGITLTLTGIPLAKSGTHTNINI